MDHSHVTYLTSIVKILDKMAKMPMKTFENELKHVFVVNLNAQSLNIYNITLHPAKLTSSRRL